MKRFLRYTWVLGAATACALLVLALLAFPNAPGKASKSPASPQTFTGRVEQINDWMLCAQGEGEIDPHVFYTSGVNTDAIGLGDTVRITYTGDITDPRSRLTASAVEKAAP